MVVAVQIIKISCWRVNRWNKTKRETGEKVSMMYFKKLNQTIASVECDKQGENISYSHLIEQTNSVMASLRIEKHSLYFIGNGGSAGIAMHMTTDFLKNGRIKTHSMHDPATLTCLGNDYGYEYVFSKQLEIVAEKGDLLVAISSSGNSPNIINAVNVARAKECRIITFSGFKPDNKLRQMGDINIYVPSKEYGIVESIHNIILQHIVDELMMRIK